MARIEPMPWEAIPEERRAQIDAGMASGAFSVREPLQIFAYADHAEPPADGDRHPQFPDSLLNGRLVELLRIRSGQLGGCERCMASRKVISVTDSDAACMAISAADPTFSQREQRALEFLNLLATDHHAIDDGTYLDLGAVFTTAEIVELGLLCGQMIGVHRFLHTLDVFSDAEPLIVYRPGQVGVSIGDAGAPALEPLDHDPRKEAS